MVGPTVLQETLNPRKGTRTTHTAWWTDDEQHAHATLVSVINALIQDQSDLRNQYLRHAYLYQNHAGLNRVLANVPGLYSGARLTMPDQYAVTYNVIKSSVDTLTAKIAQTKPRPRVITERGDWGKHTKARKLSQYLDGSFAAAKTYQHGSRAFRDAGIFGTGIIKSYVDHSVGLVRTERVLPSEVLVDRLAAASGDPREMYQVRRVSRSVLCAAYPEHADKIRMASPADVDISVHGTASDMVYVYEGWHLAPPGSEECGRHVLAIDGASLVYDDWEYPRFPFSVFRFCPRVADFWGSGIAEELFGVQLEINKLLRDIQRAQHMVASPKLLVDRAARVAKGQLNNDAGSVILYDRVAPKVVTPSAMSSEIYNHVKWLVQSAYEKIGLSQLSTAGKKPGGLDSGKALREMRDIESERFADLSTEYENFFLDVADAVITFSDDLTEGTVTAQNRKFIESIPWKEVRPDGDRYVLRMYASSMFPTEPSARLQKVEEYVRAGWMEKDAAIELFDFPDVEAWESLETAERTFVEYAVNAILDKGEWVAPEPELDAVRATNFARKASLEARACGVDEERVAMLLRWIDQLASMASPPPDPVAPVPMSPLGVGGPVAPEMAPPQASPMAPPVSGMLPVGPAA